MRKAARAAGRRDRGPIPRRLLEPRRSQWASEEAYIEALTGFVRERHSGDDEQEAEPAGVVADFDEAMRLAKSGTGPPRKATAEDRLWSLYWHVRVGSPVYWLD